MMRADAKEANSVAELYPAVGVERFAANVIDMAIFVATLSLVFVGFEVHKFLGAGAIIATILFAIYNNVILLGLKGYSLGKKRKKLRLLRKTDGLPIGVVLSLVRSVLTYLMGPIDILFIVFASDHQRLSDKLLKANVFEA